MKVSLVLGFIFTFLQVIGQIAYVERLGSIYEEDTRSIIIEPTGRMSYIKEKSILFSKDEGKSWDEIKTPYNLQESTGTIYVTTYKGLSNGDYILHTSNTIHFFENGLWKPLSINGDTLLNRGIHVDGNNVYFFKENNLYLFDPNSKIIKHLKSFSQFCCFDLFTYKNHLVVYSNSSKYEVYTKNMDHVTTLNYKPIINEKGEIFRMSTKYQGNGKYGSSIEITVDNGISYSVLYENPNEEYCLIGAVEDKLYYRGFISQSEAWSSGHRQARLGYIDTRSGEKMQINDGSNQKHNNLPVIVNNNLFHNINGAIIEYLNGDFTQRRVLFEESMSPTQIKKLRVANDGTYYAMTKAFLYRSEDKGKQWERLLDNHAVVDFDLSNNQNLYCISNDQIMKSPDKGKTYSILSIKYPKGEIDYPYEVICTDANNLMVKGIGHHITANVSVGCFDCLINYPDFIFTSSNDGLSWSEKYVYSRDYPNVTATNVYKYPSNFSVQSRYYVTNSNEHIFLDNYQLSFIDKSTFTQSINNLTLGEWPYNYYGLTNQGHLVRSKLDELSFSKNNALTFQKLGTTNHGRVYPGFNPESVFVISEEQESKGSLAYLPSYNKSIANLIVKLEDSGQVVLDSFDLVYTDGRSIFLLLDTNCYKITSIAVISSGLIEEANNFENYFKIYPNPVNEVINICKLNYHSISNARVKLFNDKLSLINSFDFETDNLQIDTKNLSPGIYYIFLYSNLECKVSKFIKI